MFYIYGSFAILCFASCLAQSVETEHRIRDQESPDFQIVESFTQAEQIFLSHVIQDGSDIEATTQSEKMVDDSAYKSTIDTLLEKVTMLFHQSRDYDSSIQDLVTASEEIYEKCNELIEFIEEVSQSTSYQQQTKKCKQLKAAVTTEIAFKIENEVFSEEILFLEQILVDVDGNVNYRNIKDLYISASELGNSTAMFRSSMFNSLSVQNNILQLYFAALDGSVYAQIALGYRHFAGLGVPQDCNAGVLYYAEAARQTSEIIESRGTEMLRDFDRFSLGLDTSGSAMNRQDIIDFYSLMAGKGDVSKMYALGEYYLYGRSGTIKNVKKAIEYFEQAANKKHAKSYGALGDIYLYNMQPEKLSIEERRKKAEAYFMKAVETATEVNSESNRIGAGMGFNGLGYLKLYSEAVRKGVSPARDENRRQAFEYFKKAILAENLQAYYNLASLYLTGYGAKVVDYDKAVGSLKVAASKGHTLSQHKLGELYLHGIGVERSCDMALAYFRAVTEKSDEVISLLVNAKNFDSLDRQEQSLQLYMIGSELGVETAQNNAAYLLHKGVRNVFAENIEDDTDTIHDDKLDQLKSEESIISEVATYLWKVDEMLLEMLLSILSPLDVLDLGSWFQNLDLPGSTSGFSESSFDAERGSPEALRFLYLAAEQGNLAARIKIGDYFYYSVLDENSETHLPLQLRESLKENTKTKYEIAAHHYKKASEFKVGQALFNLGYMHQTGTGLPQDFHLAKRYYDDAKEHDPNAVLPASLALIGLYIHRIWHYVVNGGAILAFPSVLKPLLKTTRQAYILFTKGEVLNSDASETLIQTDALKEPSWATLDEDIVVILILFALLIAVNAFRQHRQQQRQNVAFVAVN